MTEDLKRAASAAMVDIRFGKVKHKGTACVHRFRKPDIYLIIVESNNLNEIYKKLIKFVDENTSDKKCDCCGLYFPGKGNPVVNENGKIQRGLIQCDTCYLL